MTKPMTAVEQVAEFGFNVFGKKAVKFDAVRKEWAIKFTTISRDIGYEYVSDEFVREAAAQGKKIDRNGCGDIILK